MRIRNGLTQASITFFQENGFLQVQVPVITATDCDGSKESFVVTTLPLSPPRAEDDESANSIKLETIKASIKEKSKKVEELRRSESNKEALAAAVQDLKKTSELVSQFEAKRGQKSGKSAQTVEMDFSRDFFSCKTYLSVSGRLHLESYASALGNVFSVGPRFRASTSESKKLLSEMSMVEVELAFSGLEV